MASEEKWYFSKDQLDNTPSRKCGFDAYKELFYRQQAANFIQDMGQRLRVTQLCINTATVYMHRFYVFHSFTHFPWHSIAAAALFLSAKVEEQPRKLEHVIRIHNICKNPRDTGLDVQSERYQAQSQDLVFNENILLQTLGFDVAIDHPHAYVVRCCHLVRASKDLAQTSYFMASTSLHLTTMCLQYKPTVVACFCIHLACKWSNWEIPLSNEKKEWFSYVDPTVTAELLQQLTEEFLVIFERCPSRLKEKIMAIGDGSGMSRSTTQTASPFDSEPRKLHPPTDLKDPHHRLHHHEKANADDPHKHRSRPLYESGSSSQQQREREYREKKERERLAQQQQHSAGGKPPIPHANSSSGKPPNVPHGGGHHRPPVDPQMKQHSRPPSIGHAPHREPLRPPASDAPDKDPSKDPDKRGYPVKSEGNSVPQEHYDKRLKPALDPKALHKQPHESRHDPKAGYKSESDARKQHWFDSKNVYDKNNPHLKQQQQQPKIKSESPFTPDAPISKSVLNKPIKTESHNGSSGSSSNGGYGLPLVDDLVVKQDIKEELSFHPPTVKKPSMFSPEKSPPRKPVVKQRPEQNIPTPISPLDPFVSGNSKSSRQRTGSSSSEPELRPVMKKMEQVEGLENILRDNAVGIKLPNFLSFDHTAQEAKTADSTPANSSSNSVPLSQPIVNGIETNPTLISNLLKEAPSVPHLPTIANSTGAPAPAEEAPAPAVSAESKEKEHHHKDRKKKSKEKHKHKDKDKSRGDKEKKKKYKDKDKDKERHKSKKDKEKVEEVPTPIKITISKDKIQQPPVDTPPPVGLKIKIPKDRIKTDGIGESASSSSAAAPPTTPSPIKIKISKEAIMGGESKKRERDRGVTSEAPPMKIHKSSYSKQQHHAGSDKQNGRSSFGKVSNYSSTHQRPPPPPHPHSQYNKNLPPSNFNSAPMNYFYNFPPPQMHNMSVPPPHAPYMYDPGMYQVYGTGYPVFPQHGHHPGMYQPPQPPPRMVVGGDLPPPPPLPNDAPPDLPPPPPPE